MAVLFFILNKFLGTSPMQVFPKFKQRFSSSSAQNLGLKEKTKQRRISNMSEEMNVRSKL